MDFIKGTPREQAVLFPAALDDYIAENNPVRFIDVFVDQLDLVDTQFQRTEPASTGRPPFDPRDLLKLYVYGYLNRIRSSRRLEKEAHRNVELMWLLKKLRPDHKTIADFRKDNRKAFKEVFRAFLEVCRKLELFGNELVAVDGSKFKASNSSRRNFTKDQLKGRVKWINDKIDEYLNDLDRADEEGPTPVPAPTREELQEKIKRLRKRKVRTSKLLAEMEAQKLDEVSLTDPDSRRMPRNPKASVGYNVQLAVDAKHALIVAHDVINHPSDRPLLGRMSEAAKNALGVEEITVIADAGYYKGEEIKRCEDQGIHPYVPKPATSSATPHGLYSKDQFTYDKQRDLYICPAGEEMPYERTAPTKRPDHRMRYYGTKACKACPHRPQCTTNKKGQRWITRWEHEEVLDQMEQRIRSSPEILARRKELVEHPFGTIKFWNDQSHFLVRGIEKVKAEFSLMAMAQNLKRVISLVGVPNMVQAAL